MLNSGAVGISTILRSSIEITNVFLFNGCRKASLLPVASDRFTVYIVCVVDNCLVPATTKVVGSCGFVIVPICKRSVPAFPVLAEKTTLLFVILCINGVLMIKSPTMLVAFAMTKACRPLLGLVVLISIYPVLVVVFITFQPNGIVLTGKSSKLLK
jgi:hypothetical protein